LGSVVATVKTPGLIGRRLILVEPTDSHGKPEGELLVAVDLVSAANGQQIFFVRSREAANALDDPFNPVDAAVLGIVDRVTR
jgi:ethanolamine utilization protein EutN